MSTDIEGLTRVLEGLGPDDYREALERYRELLRRAIDEVGGVEVGTEGTSLLAVFVTASEAIRAAVNAQSEPT